MKRCCLVLALLLWQVCPVSNLLALEKPNIVWIMSEDNSKHYLKHFDETGAVAPNIEALAANGVTFDRAFSCGAVCSVARTTLITSVYAPRLATQYHRRIGLAKMPGDWQMFPAYLRDAGYYTTNNSKKDYNAVEPKGVWDESSNKAHWKNRPDKKPFFHVQTYGQSHESSLHFKQEWADNPDNKTLTNSVKLAPYHPDTPLFRLTYAHYHDRIKVIDEQVGNLIQQLTNDGELENTFIFYFGDHGGVLPRGKGYIYESGLHVPLVVRVPEKWKQLSPFQKGERTKGFVEFVDFGPTVLKLAGAEVPAHVDGTPFLGKGVSTNDVDSRNSTFGYVDRMDEKYDFCRSIRQDNWKYIRNYQAIYPDGLQNNYRYEMLAYREWREMFREGKLNATQQQFFQPKPAEMLFDLSADPYEVHNVAGQAEHQATLQKLRSTLSAQVKSLPDLSFVPESAMVAEAIDDPIAYGQKHKTQIAGLVDIADLAVQPLSQSKEKLRAAIHSTDPWARYWAFSVCGILGEQANAFYETAQLAQNNDTDLLVRLRAAEFLGVTGKSDPIPTIRNILQESDAPTVNLIALQTLVHFKDGPFKYDTSLDTSSVKAVNGEVSRRLGYLDGMTMAEMKKKMRQKTGKKKKSASQ